MGLKMLIARYTLIMTAKELPSMIVDLHVIFHLVVIKYPFVKLKIKFILIGKNNNVVTLIFTFTCEFHIILGETCFITWYLHYLTIILIFPFQKENYIGNGKRHAVCFTQNQSGLFLNVVLIILSSFQTHSLF